MHKQYDKIRGHVCDFRVKYRFYTREEGGRAQLPFQGYRPDFWYEHSEHPGTDQLFMIWPEFEDENQEVILDTLRPVPEAGTARMWIVVKERRHYHKDKIHTGLIGYFMEGNRKVAICEVIEIVGLAINVT